MRITNASMAIRWKGTGRSYRRMPPAGGRLFLARARDDPAGGVGRSGSREDVRRVVGTKLVSPQDEFRIFPIARRLVDGLPGEFSDELVFVPVIESEATLFPVGGQLLLLVQHHKLRGAPRLPRLAHKAPKFVVHLVESAADVVVAGFFGFDAVFHRHPARLDALELRSGLAAW